MPNRKHPNTLRQENPVKKADFKLNNDVYALALMQHFKLPDLR
jgi:hypothetical protein